MQSAEPQILIFRHIQAGDTTSKFSLGDASKVALKIFLQKEALEFHRKEIAKTYVIVEKHSWLLTKLYRDRAMEAKWWHGVCRW